MAAPKSMAAAAKRGPLSKMAYGIKQRGTKGALRRQLGASDGIPTERLRSIQAQLHKKVAAGKKLTASEHQLSARVNAALRFRGK